MASSRVRLYFGVPLLYCRYGSSSPWWNSAWLGREISAQAVARGHAVTCLARGTSGPDVHDTVVEQRWDAVFDVARQPGHVRRAVDALEPVVNKFLCISSGNVYASQRELDQNEHAELLPPLGADVMESMELYGEAKAACEQAVLSGFGPDRVLVARVGLTGGPGDTFGRTGYWPWRFSHPSNNDAAVLVPDDPHVPTAVIDVRGLAAWLVTCAEAGTTGVVNAAGEPKPLSEHLAVARTVAGHAGSLVPASKDWLREHGVVNTEWFPGWVPRPCPCGPMKPTGTA